MFEVGLQGDLPTFEAELARFAALDLDLFVHEMSLAHGGARCTLDAGAAIDDPTVIGDPDYVAQVVAAGRRAGSRAGGVRPAPVRRAAAVRDEVVELLQRYWDLAFAGEWERIRPRIEAEVTDGARTLVTAGMPGLVTHFLPEGTWDPATRARSPSPRGGNAPATSRSGAGCCSSRRSSGGRTC